MLVPTLSKDDNLGVPMRRWLLATVLGIEAVACVVLAVTQVAMGNVLTAAAIPFEQIGDGLRALSLTGPFGNVIATIVYAVISLIPLACVVVMAKRRRFAAEDVLLALVSPLLFWVLYVMINPGVMNSWVSTAGMSSFAKAILGIVVYAMLIGYVSLHIVRLFSAGDTTRLLRYAAVMLGALGVVLVYVVCYSQFTDLLNSIDTLQKGNHGQNLGLATAVLIACFVLNALPYVLNVIVIFASGQFLKEMRNDRYSAASIAAAQLVSRLCTVMLVVIILASIAANLLQLGLLTYFAGVNVVIQIPVLAMGFVLAVMLLTRLVTQNKQLKDDNDLFV